MTSGNILPAGYVFLLLMTSLEFFGLPVPGGLLVAVASAALPEGKLRLVPLIVVAAIGAAAGDTPWYFLGRFGGSRLLHLYCKFTLGSRACVSHTETFFHRFGILSLVVSKMFSGVRLFAPPMAGMMGYPFAAFLGLDLLGGFLWATVFVLAGRVFGPRLLLSMGNRTIWIITVVPFFLFFLVRVAKRAIKGPAEDVLVRKSPSQPFVVESSNAGGPFA